MLNAYEIEQVRDIAESVARKVVVEVLDQIIAARRELEEQEQRSHAVPCTDTAVRTTK